MKMASSSVENTEKKMHRARTGTLQIMQKNHCPCLVDPFFFFFWGGGQRRGIGKEQSR
jgi:hypothetical protein